MSQLIKALSGESPWINVKYFAHLFAGNQIVGDPKLYDISGAGNDGYNTVMGSPIPTPPIQVR